MSSQWPLRPQRGIMRHVTWFLFSALTFLTVEAMAKPFEMGCITEQPTTSFLIKEVNQEIVATIYLHHGVQFAPVFQGVATYRDFPILQEQAKGVLKLANAMTFRWPLKNCKIFDAIRFQCFGSNDEQAGIDGAKIKPFSIYSGKVSEESIAGKLDWITVRFGFQVDSGESSAIDMKYPAVT
jgi:hypothetical protein